MNACIILPAHNEALNLPTVIREIGRHSALPIILVDDCSSDNTASIEMPSQVRVLRLSERLGAWGAVQTGMQLAIRLGFDAVVTMDADGQHPAIWLGHLLAPIASGEADVTIGAFLERGSGPRKLAWRVLRALSALAVEDITSGYRAYNKRALESLIGPQGSLLDFQDVGVLLLLQAQEMRVKSVPITMVERLRGDSKIFSNGLKIAAFLAVAFALSISKRKKKSTNGRGR